MEFTFVKLNRLSVFHTFEGINWFDVGKFMRSWSEGTRGKLAITKIGKPKSREQLGYFYAVILPEAVKAFLANEDFSLNVEFGEHKIEVELTLKNMDTFLKQRYAAMTGVYVDKSEMNMAQCSAFEDWCIKWLATWLNCQIPPADKDWAAKGE